MFYLEKKKEKGSDFRMSDVIKVQTGIQKIETHMSEEDIENRVLARLKEVQETAFQEAYQLGLDGQGDDSAPKINPAAFNVFVPALRRLATQEDAALAALAQQLLNSIQTIIQA